MRFHMNVQQVQYRVNIEFRAGKDGGGRENAEPDYARVVGSPKPIKPKTQTLNP